MVIEQIFKIYSGFSLQFPREEKYMKACKKKNIIITTREHFYFCKSVLFEHELDFAILTQFAKNGDITALQIIASPGQTLGGALYYERLKSLLKQCVLGLGFSV